MKRGKGEEASMVAKFWLWLDKEGWRWRHHSPGRNWWV